MKLIANKILNGHVSLDTINEFENVVLSNSDVEKVVQKNQYFSYFLYVLYKTSIKLGFLTFHSLEIISKYFPKLKTNHFFVIMMGLDIMKCLPHFYIPFQKKSIYLFDAWQGSHDQIKHFVDFFKIENIFVSSLSAAETLKSKLKNSNVHWIPEGINPQEYSYSIYEKKNIDVIAVGRRYDNYHYIIVEILKKLGKIYLYEKVKGEIIFPSREEFKVGLGRSRISICVPSSITHPDRAGNIETMTIRYLQSMVSKCLILGHAPEEMIELFGYNPVIEIDMQKPQEQLLSILNDYNNYIPLIEKNYSMAVKNHTWECRWVQIQNIINN